MRFLIVDDHPIVRSGLRKLLGFSAAAEIVEAANAAEAAAAVAACHFDLVILDLNLPGRGGMDLLADLVAATEAPILVLSMHGEPYYVRHALGAGAAGYLSKNAPPEELLNAVRRILAGGSYVEGDLAQAVALDRADDPDRSRLSARDLEVLRHLANGANLSTIAADLGLSYKTVANHCSALKAKVGAASLADLVRLAVEIRLQSPRRPQH